MTAQVSHSVPQLPLSNSMHIDDGFLRIAELEGEDLQGQSKSCIDQLLRGNSGLKAKTAKLQESRVPTRLSNPETKTKVIDLRQTQKAQVEVVEGKVSGSFQEEVKSYRSGTKSSKQKGKPSDPINLPRYGRGQDPAPWLRGTYMEQPAGPRSKIVDNHKRAYEAKYENYLSRKKWKLRDCSNSQKIVILDSENVRAVKQAFEEMDREKTGLVEKQNIMRWLHENRDFARLFGLEFLCDVGDYMQSMEEVLGNIGAREDVLDLGELLSFYQISRNNKDPSISVVSDQASIDLSMKAGPTVLPIPLIQLMRAIYDEINTEEKPLIDSEEYLERLKVDIDIQANVDTPAVQTEDGMLSLGQVLANIANTCEETHLVSWEIVATHLWLLEPKQKQVDPDHVMLTGDQIQAMYSAFLTVSEDQDSAPTAALIRAIRESGDCVDILPLRAREPMGISRYPEETIGEVLDRIEQFAGESITWSDFVGYFTTLGEPGRDAGYESDPERYQSVSPVAERAQVARSLSPESRPQLGERYAITVPKPFNFTTRERVKRKPIRQVKLEEMLAEKERKEMEPCQVRIHANPVPAEVIIPRYEDIVRKNEERRRQVKLASVEMTKHSERPFSFYYRDMNKVRPVADFYPEPFVFKANPIPWESTVPLLERMNTEGEELRKIRIEARAKELYAQSKLPPRMHMHQAETSKVTKTPKRPHSAYAIRHKPVPDFPTLQATFQRQLESRKQNFKSTVPQPFHFNESRKTAQYREYMDHPDAPQQWVRPKPADLAQVFKRPSKEPSSTEKHKALVELRKKEQMMRERAREEKEAEEAARMERRERMKPIVQQSEVIVDNTRALSDRREQKLKEAKREAKEKEREYQIAMAEMMERVYARPLMVEQVAEDARRKAYHDRELLEQRNRASEEGMDSDMPFSEEEQPYGRTR